MNNHRGGVISSLIIIPAALVLMIGFFFLGYYVGKHHGAPTTPGESAPPLPDMLSKNLPKPEEFTFFKTLTDRENRTVSIELKPRAGDTEAKPEKPAADASNGGARQPAKEKEPGTRAENKVPQAESAKPNAVKPSPAPEKKAAPEKTAALLKLRYTIQLSSHQEKHSAEDEVKMMKKNGYAAFIVASELPGMGTWYRVRLGSFLKRESAEKLQKEVRTKVGISPIIVVE